MENLLVELNQYANHSTMIALNDILPTAKRTVFSLVPEQASETELNDPS